MKFLMDWFRNIILLGIIIFVLFLISPDMMRQVFQVYGALLGPIAILMLAIFSLPRKSRK